MKQKISTFGNCFFFFRIPSLEKKCEEYKSEIEDMKTQQSKNSSEECNKLNEEVEALQHTVEEKNTKLGALAEEIQMVTLQLSFVLET